MGVVLGTACSLLFWLSPASGQEDEASLKDWVRSEYPAALKALESRFAKAYGSGTSAEEFRIGTKGHIRTDGRLNFALNGPFLAKVALHISKTTMKDQKTSPPQEVVFCYNTQSSFWLTKPAGNSEYALKSLETSKDEASGPHRQVYDRLKFLYAPYTVGTLRMSDAIARPNFSIRRVEATGAKDRALLKIEFDLKNSRGLSAWVVLAPGEKWAIQEYESKDIQDVIHGRIEYGELMDGFPTPKRVLITRTKVGETHPAQSYAFDFDEIHFADVPDREFSFAAFGLPDLGRPRGMQHGMRTGLLLLGIAIVMIIVASMIKKQASHRFRKA